MSADRLEQCRRLGDRLGERADLVKRRTERDQAVAAHSAVRRLHADEAAERGWLADRTAGIGTQRQRGEVSGDCRSRTATRTTRDASRVERILRRERRVLVDEPIANSSRLVLPTMTAPAATTRCTTVAS